jgi:hypothetical protein
MCAALRNRFIPPLIKGGLFFSAGMSLFTLLLYALGTDFSDRTLLLLLGALRFFSLLLCLFALASLCYTVRALIRGPAVKHALCAVLYLGIAAASAVLIAANSFIAAVAGGN